MFCIDRSTGQWIRGILIGIVIILVMMNANACGSAPESQNFAETGDDEQATQLIRSSDRLFQTSDFQSIGMKHSKDYKTEGLPGANQVSLFFWKMDGTPIQYEIRFYPDHDEAVSSGLTYALEGAGPDAIIDPDFARYTEGLRDRRTIVHTRSSPSPRYGDFVIYGNIIALCEGRDVEQASERCAHLVNAFDGNAN